MTPGIEVKRLWRAETGRVKVARKDGEPKFWTQPPRALSLRAWVGEHLGSGIAAVDRWAANKGLGR